MDHPALVGMSQGLGRLKAPARDVRGRQRLAGLPGIGQDIRQAAPLDKLHRVVMDAALAADGEDRHDVGMVQPRDGLGLAMEPLHGLLVRDGAEPEDLQGHPTAERGLLGLVDDAHAAAADLADDAEIAERGRFLDSRAGRAVDELDAGQARIELHGQLRMARKQLVTVGSPAGLEVGHVAVEDADDRRGRAGGSRRFLRVPIVGIRLVDRAIVGLGHRRRSRRFRNPVRENPDGPSHHQ